MNDASSGPPRGGMLELVHVAFPLVLASSGHTFRLFADRIMLARYSPEAMAGSMPAGLLCFALMAFFIGTVGYVNTFVAQFTGAGQPRSTGLAVWQGIYLSAMGGIAVAAVSLFSEPIFAAMGHSPEVQAEEVPYFNILCWLSFPGIALSSLNAFWSGRGKTRVVMVIELFCAGVNIGLNALLIFGLWIFPELGIVGAGLATALANAAGLLLAMSLFLSRSNRETFGSWPDKTFDMALFRRVIRYGLPSGLQFGFDLLAFMFFIAILGKYGNQELIASNIAFALNSLTYLPLIGLGVAVSVLVGQNIGASEIARARRLVRSALYVALIFSLVVGGLFLLYPEAIVSIFSRPGDAGHDEALLMAQRCIAFIAGYLLFDAVYMVCSHAIKGAGDTRFALIAGAILSWGSLALPSYIAFRLGASFWTLWTILVVHVFIASVVFSLRYWGGKWQEMRVIDSAPAVSAELDIQTDRGL
jgi:MATE family multidrug resistance protein